MKIIRSKTHGYLDYIFGVLLITSPGLFAFYNGGMESWIVIILGSGILVYSMLTDYELGLVKKIPMRVHLILDIMAGILLAASPWLFGFSEVVYLPHLIIGITEALVAVLTDPRPLPEPQKPEIMK